MMMVAWKKISEIGIRHVANDGDKNVLRFINQLNFFAVVSVIGHAIILQLQLDYKYPQVFLWELSYLPLAACIYLLNTIGHAKAARWFGSLSVIGYTSFLYIFGGNYFGGSYLLLVTGALPMIIFRRPLLYTFFFLLHVIAFFLIYYYQQYYPPFVNFTADEQKALYPGGVVFMFLIAYASIRYFINLNQSYAAELSKSKQLIQEKKQEIISSINYTHRIQTSILTSEVELMRTIPSAFILNMPKDIVSGDFFWARRTNDDIYFAVCDCTGHGVPAAMISIICHNALNRAFDELDQPGPAQLFTRVQSIFSESFNAEQYEVNPGMEGSICRISLQEGAMSWCGAKTPLWVWRDHEIIEHQPNRFGISREVTKNFFKEEKIGLSPGDCIFLFTDGYADQFGKDSGKKLKKSGMRTLLKQIGSMKLSEQKSILKNYITQFRGAEEQVDDICILAYQYHPESEIKDK
jgi:serine phosphatase RsbU (regulator of sigma subunit)